MRGHVWWMVAVLVVGVATTFGGGQWTDAWGENRSGALITSADCTQNVIPRNDDSYSSTVQLPFQANFYGQTYEQLWVNNNGNVTFDGPMSTFTPFPLSAAGRAIIAPYFGDVDTRGAASDVVRYGWGETTFDGRRAFCVNWIEVGYYNGGTDKRNSFQLLLVDRSDIGAGDFDIVFNYGSVQWEAGSASGGSGGLGGSSARVGFANGDRSAENSFELPGSGINGRLLDSHPEGLIRGSLGTKHLGRYQWSVRNGKPNPNTPPVASAGDDVTVGEGDVAALDAGASSDPDGDPLQYKWQRIRGTGPAAQLSSTVAPRPTVETLDDSEASFRVTVDDGKGGQASDEVAIRASNVAPAVTAADMTGSARGATVLAATFTDPGLLDDHTAIVDWGDGSVPENVAITAGAGWGSVVGSHRYGKPGSYTAKVTVEDDDGGMDTTEASVAISEPAAIFAISRTGGPAIDWSGSKARIRGAVHSNSDIKVSGSENRVDGTTTYVTEANVGGSRNTFAAGPKQVAVAAPPIAPAIADFEPGGRVAREVGASRYFDKTAACRQTGKWDRSGSSETLATGVYYVPCEVHLSGSDLRGEVTVASTGAIRASGSNIEARAHFDGILLFTSAPGNDAIHVSGSGQRLTGFLAAPEGEVQLSGSHVRQSCGIVADRIKLNGSSGLLTAADCTRPRGATVALSSLVPTPKLGVTVDDDAAQPGDELTYEATLTNAGATLVASGLVGAENVGDSTATVASYAYALEYLPADRDEWQPLAGAAKARGGYAPREPAAIDRGVTLTTHPMSSPGVSYERDGILDASLSPGTLGAWGYQARVQLTPAQVKLLADPERVRAVRNTVHLELIGTPHVRELYRFGDDFAAKLRADGGDLEDAMLTIAPPAGDPAAITKDAEPRLARIAPGDAVSVEKTWLVPALPARAEAEPAFSYVARLKAADDAAMRGAARARTTAGRSKLLLPQQTTSTTRRLPVVALDKEGPATLLPGDRADYDLRLANEGSAPASGLAVTDNVVATGAATVTGAPGTLAPGERRTARASHTVPTGPATSLADVGAVTWSDANGNEYGPVDERFTTRVVTPSRLSVTKFDWHDQDVDGDGTISPGDVLEYEVTVENTGTETLPNVVMTDRLDLGTTLVDGSVNPSQGTVIETSPELRVSLGTLPGRRTATVRFKARIADRLAGAATTVSNQARVSATGQPEVLSDDRGEPGAEDPTVTRVRSRAPRLELTKQDGLAVDRDGDGEPSPGDTLAYVVALQNSGDASATGVVLTDRPGTHTTLVPGSASATAGTLSTPEGSVRVELASLAPGDDARVELRATIADRVAAGTDRVANQAAVDSHQTTRVVSDDPATEAEDDPTSTALTLHPRLDADKTDALLEDRDGNGVASPGDRLAYEITVRNASGIPATGVEVADRPGANTTLVAGSAQASQGVAQESDGAVLAHLGEIAPGATASVELVAQINPLPAGEFRVANQARVDSAELPAIVSDDPDANGPSDATVTPVVATAAAPPALTVKKRDSLAVDLDGDGRPSPGDTLSYELTVWNSGGGAASDVVVTDPVDPNAPLLVGSVQAPADATVEQGNAAGDTQVKVRLGELQPSSGARITYQAKINQVLPAGVMTVGGQAEAATPETGTVGSYDPDAPGGGGETETTVDLPPAAQPAIGAVSPADGATVTEPVVVTARLTPPAGQSIDSWCVRIRQAGSGGAGRNLKCGDGAPAGELAKLDPTVLVNGAYELIVEATASGGGVQRQATTLVVEGDLKLGRSSMTYQDLEVPLHGLPIQVLRTYDSFDKVKGGFGVGWNAAVANVRVQVNRRLGDGGWSHQLGNCTTVLGQSICLGREFHDLSSHFVTVTWPDGRTELFDFTPHAGSGGIYYDASARFTPRRATTSTLAPLGDPTLQYWGDGNLYEADGETLYQPTRFLLTSREGTRFELDTELGLVSAETRHGEKLTVSDDGIESSTGRSVTFVRDVQERITRITGPSGERLDYGYDAAGNLATVKDVSGDTLSYGYDAEHNLTSVTGPDNRPLRTLTYDAEGRLASVTDGSGRTTDVDVDVTGRQEVVTEPGGGKTSVLTSDEDGDVVRVDEIAGGVTRTWRSEYDADGNRTRLVDPLGLETKATFDTGGNPTSMTDPNGRTTRMTYDDRGRLARVVRPDGATSVVLRRNEFGDVVESDSGGGRITRFTYDALGRIDTTTDPLGRVTDVDHDASGNPVHVDGPEGGLSLTWDASGRPTAVTDETGQTTGFAWNAEGELLERSDGLSEKRTYGYDASGRITSETDANGRSRTWTYDDAGRLSSTTDRNGKTTQFGYDAAGRLARETVDGDVVEHEHDGFGRLRRVQDADTAVRFEYDLADRVIEVVTRGLEGSNLPTTTVGYGYDEAGQRTSLRDAGGETRMSYDALGRLATVTDPQGGVFRYEYDALGREARLTRPNGVQTTMAWDLAGALSDVVHHSAGGTVLDEAHYLRDGAGRPTTVADRAGLHQYAYDRAGRLLTASHPGDQADEAYTYDARGNRTSSGERYDDGGRLLEDWRFSYAYDDEGRLTTKRSRGSGAATQYTWDAHGRLRRTSAPGRADTSYRYDALGRRIEATDAGGTRRFGYGAEENVLVEYGADNTVTATNSFADGLAAPLRIRRGTTPRYPLQDGLANVTALTDASGAAAERYAHSAFGEPQGGTAAFGFAGREYDSAAGAYDMRARWYDPSSGRFLSEDPLPGTAPYAYGDSSPLANWDPQGLMAVSLSELNAAQDVQASLRSTQATAAGQRLVGALYRFSEAGGKVYHGMTQQMIKSRIAQHGAKKSIDEIDEIIIMQVSSRAQLRALEQARVLASRLSNQQLSNAINAMSRQSWDDVGRQLVDDFLNSGQSIPKNLMDDLNKVLNFPTRGLPF